MEVDRVVDNERQVKRASSKPAWGFGATLVAFSKRDCRGKVNRMCDTVNAV